MERAKSVYFIVGIMLFVLAVVMAYLSAKGLLAIPSANSYEDKGIYTFSPYQVLPVQVKNTSASARDRRMNPAKTVYMVYYRTTDGSGYQWSEQALTREQGQETVDTGTSMERRVLNIPDRGNYITIEPEQTAESYTAGLRKKYIISLGLSAGYVLLYLLIWCVIWHAKRKGI